MSKNDRHIIDLIFVIALMGVFAVSSVIMVILGISVYKDTVNATGTSFETRTTLLYISERIRQTDNGTVRTGEVAGHDALITTVEYEGAECEVWIFCDGSHIREVSVLAGTAVTLTDGQEIVAAEALYFSLRNGLITTTVTLPGGEQRSIGTYLRSGAAKGGEYNEE